MGERDLSGTLPGPERDGDGDGDLLTTVLGDYTVAWPEVTFGVAPFHCIMFIMANKSNTCAWLKILGIEGNSVAKESVERSEFSAGSTACAGTWCDGPVSILRNSSSHARWYICAGWSWSVRTASARLGWDGPASSAGTVSNAGTGRVHSSNHAGSALPAGPGRVGSSIRAGMASTAGLAICARPSSTGSGLDALWDTVSIRFSSLSLLIVVLEAPCLDDGGMPVNPLNHTHRPWLMTVVLIPVDPSNHHSWKSGALTMVGIPVVLLNHTNFFGMWLPRWSRLSRRIMMARHGKSRWTIRWTPLPVCQLVPAHTWSWAGTITATSLSGMPRRTWKGEQLRTEHRWNSHLWLSACRTWTCVESTRQTCDSSRSAHTKHPLVHESRCCHPLKIPASSLLPNPPSSSVSACMLFHVPPSSPNPCLANFKWSLPGTLMSAFVETALLTFFLVVTASSEMRALWKFRGRFLRRRTVVAWFCHLVTRKLRRHQTRNKVRISPKFAVVKTPNTWDQLTRTSSATSCFFPAYVKLLPGMATGSVSGAYNCPLAMRELKWQADGRLQGLRSYSCTL